MWPLHKATDASAFAARRARLGLPRSLLTLPAGSPRFACCSIHSTTVAMGIPSAPHAIEAVRSGPQCLHRWHLSRLRTRLSLPCSLLALPTGSPRVTCCSIHSTTVAMGLPTAPHAIHAVHPGRRCLHRWHLSRVRARSSHTTDLGADRWCVQGIL